MSILYIDDDEEDLEVFHEAVKMVDPSIRFVTATSGGEAFELLAHADRLPDHIVMDINMPGMDGKTCLQELRKQKRFDGVNLILYSTNSFPQDIKDIEALGAAFVKKANSFQDLCDIVRKLAHGEPRK